jgi:hypothetical protein
VYVSVEPFTQKCVPVVNVETVVDVVDIIVVALSLKTNTKDLPFLCLNV